MHKASFKYGIWILFVIVAASCASTTEDEAVAKVGEKVLYQSNLKEILPANYSAQDSVLLVNDYINKWIKQELLIQKADENLSVAQKDVSKELQAYRNSLIIYKYKNELIKQRLDTVVSTNEIESYYRAHTSDFNLNRCIVKAIFVQVPADLANPALLKDLVQETSEEGIEELREYCGQYAKKVEISIDEWMEFKVLEKNFPLEINDAQSFLQRSQLQELNDSNYYYLVSIHDYKLTNDLAPIEFVENNIKNLILNQRKIKFLKEIEENVYTEGVRQNKFRIYNKKTNED